MGTTSRRSRLRRFRSFLWPYRWSFAAAALLLALEIPLSASIPLIAQRFFDRALPARDLGLAVRLCLLIAGVSLAAEGANALHGLLLNRLRLGFGFRLRLSVFRHAQRLPLSYFADRDTGYLMARQTEDVTAVEDIFAETTLRAIADAIRAALFVGLLLYLDVVLSLTAFLVVAVLAVLIAAISRPLRAASGRLRESSAQVSAALHDTLSGHALVQAAAGESRIRSIFARHLSALMRDQFRRDSMGLLSVRVSRFGTSIGVSVSLLVGVWRILGGSLTVGGMFAFFLYIGRLYDAVNNLAAANPAIQKALASADRLTEILDAEPAIRDLPGARELPIRRGAIAFRRVSFSYRPGLPVLREVDLEARPGETVALVGPSGAGKSTLVSLIPRLLDADGGAVEIDGVDIRGYRLLSLRRQVALVPQEIFLLNRSVRENLTFGLPGGRRISGERIREAAAAANAHDFIQALPDGYDTMIGERGVKLSGGERQRLAIARELLRDPRILILDEATSHLDAESERLVQEALEKLKRDRTTFVIAHRLSTILDADQILVLDGGRIAARGSHGVLLRESVLYRNLYETQFDIPRARSQSA